MSDPAAALHEYLRSTANSGQKLTAATAPQRAGPVQLAEMPPSLPTIELQDVELTTVPLMVYFRILVRPASEKGPGHHVMKTFRDLQDLDEALSRELPGAGQLPRLPPPRPQTELSEAAFCARLGGYLTCLACSPVAVETYSFKNFFQLSDEYQRWLPQPAGGSVPENDIITQVKPQTGLVAASRTVVHPAVVGPQRDGPAASPQCNSEHCVMTARSGERTDATPAVPVGRFHRQASRLNALPPDPGPVAPAPVPRAQTLPPEALRTLLRPATASAPRPPDMPQTAPEMPAAPPLEAAVRSSPPQNLSQSFSSDELGSSAEATAEGKLHRRRRPWCIVCMASPQEVALDPCGHLSMCHSCAASLKACPVCRGPIEKILRVYMS